MEPRPEGSAPEHGTAGPAAEKGPSTASGTDVVSSPPASEDPSSATGAAGTASSDDIQSQVVEALRTCFDPEIPVNIYDLGLVYSIQVDPPGHVSIRMTLTSPMCPVAGSLPPEVEAKVRSLSDVTDAKVEVVWDPPWSPSMMSEAAKLQLNVF